MCTLNQSYMAMDKVTSINLYLWVVSEISDWCRLCMNGSITMGEDHVCCSLMISHVGAYINSDWYYYCSILIGYDPVQCSFLIGHVGVFRTSDWLYLLHVWLLSCQAGWKKLFSDWLCYSCLSDVRLACSSALSQGAIALIWPSRLIGRKPRTNKYIFHC